MIFKELKDKFETAVVNEPSVFEPSKFYCITIREGICYDRVPHVLSRLRHLPPNAAAPQSHKAMASKLRPMCYNDNKIFLLKEGQKKLIK